METGRLPQHAVRGEVNSPRKEEEGIDGNMEPVDAARETGKGLEITEETADTESAENPTDFTRSGSMEIDSLSNVNPGAKGEHDSESDGDCASEGTCLEVMTPDGQDHYLRLGDTPRRRSALRLSRIIARQQLLRRMAQGR